MCRGAHVNGFKLCLGMVSVFVIVVAYFILGRRLYSAYSANLGLLCMPHPGMGPQV